jgi:hypothetical protein
MMGSRISLLASMYRNRVLPLLTQFFLIPNRLVYGSQIVVSHFLLESILLEFEQYLAVYTFSTIQ